MGFQRVRHNWATELNWRRWCVWNFIQNDNWLPSNHLQIFFSLFQLRYTLYVLHFTHFCVPFFEFWTDVWPFVRCSASPSPHRPRARSAPSALCPQHPAHTLHPLSSPLLLLPELWSLPFSKLCYFFSLHRRMKTHMGQNQEAQESICIVINHDKATDVLGCFVTST